MSAKPHRRLKLLFADDEKSLQELMRLELPRLGHEVTVCPDGHTAMAALERNTYDCLLVDFEHAGARRPGGHRRAPRRLPPTPRPSSSPASRRWRRPWRPCGRAPSTT